MLHVLVLAAMAAVALGRANPANNCTGTENTLPLWNEVILNRCLPFN